MRLWRCFNVKYFAALSASGNPHPNPLPAGEGVKNKTCQPGRLRLASQAPECVGKIVIVDAVRGFVK
jgi:hypothetical protein